MMQDLLGRPLKFTVKYIGLSAVRGSGVIYHAALSEGKFFSRKPIFFIYV